MRLCSCRQRPAQWRPLNRVYLCDPCAQIRGMLVPCPGEAHSNPFIDNCGVCMPRWGWVETIPSEPRSEPSLEALAGVVRAKALYAMELRQSGGELRHPGSVDFNIGEPIAGEEVRTVLGGYVRGNGRVYREFLVERRYPVRR